MVKFRVMVLMTLQTFFLQYHIHTFHQLPLSSLPGNDIPTSFHRILYFKITRLVYRVNSGCDLIKTDND